MNLSKFPLTKPLVDKFRESVSGDKDGRPDWVRSIAEGDDEGLFGPESAVWQVHGTIATLVGGIRALLLQACHPAPLSGVAEHSRYETDPLGRLAGTTRWLTLTTFASKAVLEREAARVNAMHSHVKGDFTSKSGEVKAYKASDPRYLLWVHCAFTDSFLTAHLSLGYPIDKGADAYVREWSKSAIALGLTDAPQSVAELDATMDSFRENELATSAKTPEVVRFILNPPFGPFGKRFYRILCNAAISTLHPNELRILGLKPRSAIWRKITKVFLDIFMVMLGGQSPSQMEAIIRCNRIRAAKQSDQ
jgi:uncharacterized protein (DUF2236 family)